MQTLRSKLEPLVENIGEATTACLITMVQGNLLVLTLGHWLIATQTGLLAGSLTAAAIMISKIKQRWLISAMLGVVTAITDFFMHPGQFGPLFLEAIVTGCGAAVLCLLIGHLLDWLRSRQSNKVT